MRRLKFCSCIFAVLQKHPLINFERIRPASASFRTSLVYPLRYATPGKASLACIPALADCFKKLLVAAIFQRKRTKAASISVSRRVRTHNVLRFAAVTLRDFSSPARAYDRSFDFLFYRFFF
jgi:hypothetical protein